MKTISLFNDKNDGVQKEKMDLMMRTLKAVHSATSSTSMSGAELSHRRSELEVFSKLVPTPVGIHTTQFMVENLPCEWTKPSFAHRTDVIILYCHGGGYTCGGLNYAGILSAKLAHHTGLEVVSFEYRLAPEHPFPAPIQDGMKVWDYLVHLGYGAKNIILAGDSAGGNMALEMCINLRDAGRILPRAMVLFSPWTDMTCQNPSYESNREKDPTITVEYIKAVRAAYAGADADFTDPALSPLYDVLTGLPPTLIQVGSCEILKDDSEKLAKKMTKSGCMVKLEVCSGGWHVFQQMPIPKAIHAIQSVKTFLDTILI